VTSTKEQRTIRVLAVQSEADVKVNETAIKWVAQQIAGRAISDAIAARDRGDAKALNRRIALTKERLTRYGRPELTQSAANALKDFEETSRDWTARTRKASRMRSVRAMRASSFYTMQPPSPGRLDDLYKELKIKGSLTADYAGLGIHDSLPAKALDKRALLDRFSGCLIGGAVGDALGRGVEADRLKGSGSTSISPGPAGGRGRRARSQTTRNSRCGYRNQ
jgi:hypothetical protein